MATLDFSTARFGFDMADEDVFGFNRVYQADPDFWLFNTPDGHAVRLTGNGLAYDAQGRPRTGLVNRIEIDLGNDNPSAPDVRITGISASAPRLDDSLPEFWHVLQGNDVIYAPDLSKGGTGATVILFGDAMTSAPGAGSGGHDVIHAADGFLRVQGDVLNVGGAPAGTPASSYRGGDDQILGTASTQHQIFIGDAFEVHGGGRLTGGDDTVHVNSRSATAVGDAFIVEGRAGALARVVGGDDFISGGSANPHPSVLLVGDVWEQRADTFVRGGADAVGGGEHGETIVGDVYRIYGPDLLGGDDALSGNGGDDRIYGDAMYVPSNQNRLAGGDDVLRGGAGDDELWGDFNNGGAVVVGGDDRLYGGDGRDRLSGDQGDDSLSGDSGKDSLSGGLGDDGLFGGSEADNLSGEAGHDLIDGGAGADSMWGGSGDDAFFVNDNLDRVFEAVGGGHDTIWSSQSAWRLRGDVEDLRYNGNGAFTGIGNGIGNLIVGGAGTDDLRGEDGDDILVGGGGADALQGGVGADTASYATSAAGVVVRLDGNRGSGDAFGDRYFGVENAMGSAFGDSLYGDGNTNRLSGGAGNDSLSGAGGHDIIVGGAGEDNLAGGSGGDTFVFNARGEVGDRVLDFSRGLGDDDWLMFEGDAFGGLPEGALAANRFAANASGAATASSHRFVYETDAGVLRFDGNGSAAGGIIEIAVFDGRPPLELADFLIA